MSEERRFATVEIAGPGRNLLNPEVMSGVEEGLRAADADPGVAGIVLTGRGEAFCAGLDTDAIAAGGDPIAFAGALVRILKLIPTLGTPVVAAVNGDAVASGASLVAACDFAVAAPHALIGTREVSIGIWPMVAQVPLIQRLGPRAAMENIGSGEPFTAERARELGLVNAVVPADEVLEAAHAWLAKAARAGAVGAVGRPTVYRLAELGYEDALDEALGLFTRMFREGQQEDREGRS